MKKRIFGTIAGLALAAAGLQAQVGVGGGGGVGVGGGVGGGVGVGRSGAAPGVLIEQFQQAGTISAVAGGRGVGMITTDRSPSVIGRPYSATEEHRSKQTLGDGTEISSSESIVVYRDSAGRMRRENAAQGTMTIVDPVARVSVSLNTATKTARKISMLGSGGETPRTVFPDRVVLSEGALPKVAASSTGSYTFTVDGASGTTITTDVAVASPAATRRTANVVPDNMQREELGVESLNGVLATHTRNTLTIPLGQIGNSRDIHVVNERWYSDDLQMLVKTVNSDPRFGENTFELVNISRDEPNASLFQIPADYTVTEMSAGRGLPLMPATTINK